MAVLTLDEIKTQLKMELDDASRDAELSQFELDAVDYCSQYIGRSIPWLDDEGAEVEVPASIKRAMKLLIGDYDQLRTNTVVGLTPANTRAAESMLHFHRVGMGI